MVADDNDNPFDYHIMDEVRRSSMPTYSRDLRPGKLLNEPKPIRVMGTYQLSDETAERWSSTIISVGPCAAVAAKPRKLRIRK